MDEPCAAMVAGGAGFIGSALVRYIVRSGESTVVTVDSLTYAGTLESLAEVDRHPRHHFAKVDIASAISALLRRHRPQATVHPQALNICWNDPDLLIPWPIRQPMLSAVDRSAARLVEIDTARLPAYAPPG